MRIILRVIKNIMKINEIGLYWREMPSRKFIGENEWSAFCFKADKDRITVLCCLNSNWSIQTAKNCCKYKYVYLYFQSNITIKLLDGWIGTFHTEFFRNSYPAFWFFSENDSMIHIMGSPVLGKYSNKASIFKDNDFRGGRSRGARWISW